MLFALQEEGVPLNRVYIGHCNDSDDMDYLTAMLERGVWLGLDRTTAQSGQVRPPRLLSGCANVDQEWRLCSRARVMTRGAGARRE